MTPRHIKGISSNKDGIRKSLGKKNKVVISNSAGSYNVIDASSDISFFHSGSSYDYDKDGYKDVLLVDATIPLIFFKKCLPMNFSRILFFNDAINSCFKTRNLLLPK